MPLDMGIEEPKVIQKILRHCNLWMVAEPRRGKEAPRPQPPKILGPPVTAGPTLDYRFTSAWLSAAL
jgi:hypothetical protein